MVFFPPPGSSVVIVSSTALDDTTSELVGSAEVDSSVDEGSELGVSNDQNE